MAIEIFEPRRADASAASALNSAKPSAAGSTYSPDCQTLSSEPAAAKALSTFEEIARKMNGSWSATGETGRKTDFTIEVGRDGSMVGTYTTSGDEFIKAESGSHIGNMDLAADSIIATGTYMGQLTGYTFINVSSDPKFVNSGNEPMVRTGN